jgi:uncharacterized protein YcfJ
MQSMIRVCMVAVLSMMLLGGCETNQDAGTAVGAVAGGLLGSNIGSGDGQTAAIIAGSIAGAYLGNQVGQSMDRTEQLRMDRASQDATNRALANDQYQEWQTSHAKGSIRPRYPARHYKRGLVCRSFEYETEIEVRERNGNVRWRKTVDKTGCACKRPHEHIWHRQAPHKCRHGR